PFGVDESRLGLGCVSVASRLAHQIPYAALMLLMASGKFLSAKEALQIGLVNSVVPDDEVFDRAGQAASAISRLPPMTLRAEKAALFHTETLPYRDAIALGNVLEVLNLLSPDALEGVSAVHEKRPAHFR